MAQHYSNKSRWKDPHALPDIETFMVTPGDFPKNCPLCDPDNCSMADHDKNHLGWFWWSCFPGCLPDSEAFGPFTTEQAALADARRG